MHPFAYESSNLERERELAKNQFSNVAKRESEEKPDIRRLMSADEKTERRYVWEKRLSENEGVSEQQSKSSENSPVQRRNEKKPALYTSIRVSKFPVGMFL